MIHRYRSCLLGTAWFLAVGLEAQDGFRPAARLSLAEALARVEKQHPDLDAARQQVEAAQARRLGASLRPNPEAEIEVEELGGSDQETVALRLSQALELGGKRSRRMVAADQGILVAEAQFQLLRASLRAEVAQAHLAAVVAAEETRLATEEAELAAEIARAVREKVEAGKVSPIVLGRAELGATRGRIAADAARDAERAAQIALAGLWGDAAPDFSEVEGTLDQVAAPQDAASALPLLDRHPAIRLALADVESRRAELGVARAAAIPDVTVQLGVSRVRADGETLFSVAASLPLPWTDRRQGEIAAAAAGVGVGEAALRAVRRRLMSELHGALAEMRARHAQAQRLRGEALPAAQRAYAAVRDGYTAGKLTYLDALESREALFAVRGDLLAALAAYHRSRIDYERLVAGPAAAPENQE